MCAHASCHLRLRLLVRQLPGGLAQLVKEERYQQAEPQRAAADDQEIDDRIAVAELRRRDEPTRRAAREAANPTPDSPTSIGAR